MIPIADRVGEAQNESTTGGSAPATTLEVKFPMKPLENPRVSLVWGGVGVLLFLTLGIMDAASGAPAFRVAAYFVLLIGAIYIFVRALMTLLGKT